MVGKKANPHRDNVYNSDYFTTYVQYAKKKNEKNKK